MTFWLGTHMIGWLARPEFARVPLFVSAVRLRPRSRDRMPRAVGPWALDSGGFSEIAAHGRWTVSPEQYVDEVRQWSDWIGPPAWAAIQDWMCEPFMVAKTGLSVAEHQSRTVDSYLTLRRLAPEQPWVPVLQGWRQDDYHAHADQYAAAGIDLAGLPVVGLGSVCRRQGTREAGEIVRGLYARGLKNLHGFGFKTKGLTGGTRLAGRLARYLASSDSMAWSTRARKAWKHDGKQLCGTGHLSPRTGLPNSCANCQTWALAWRARLCDRIDRVTREGTQQLLF